VRREREKKKPLACAGGLGALGMKEEEEWKKKRRAAG
jgi:hypothetical protein